MAPTQEAKAQVYRGLRYRPAGMVGVNLAVAWPLTNGRKGFCVQLIEPGGKTVKMLIRYR